MTSRRKLIVALGAGALMPPFAARAQAPATRPATPTATPAAAAGKIWRVGVLGFSQRPASLGSHFYGGILQGLRDLGYVEGKNLVIEWRFADNDAKRLAALAAELMQWKPDVLVSLGDQSSAAMKDAVATLPIVSAGSSDPVGNGLIKSLARPGGNITGLSLIGNELAPKLLELLLAMASGAVPKVTRVAVLLNPTSAPQYARLRIIEAAAKTIGINILPFEAQDLAQIDAAFAGMRQERAGALIVFLHPFFQERRQQIADLALKFRLPSMTGASVYPEAGCLMSYGTNLHELFRRAAYFIDRIFKGAKPADLPFEQPTRFELVINGKTAKALGLKIPQSLLIFADRVIE